MRIGESTLMKTNRCTTKGSSSKSQRSWSSTTATMKKRKTFTRAAPYLTLIETWGTMTEQGRWTRAFTCERVRVVQHHSLLASSFHPRWRTWTSWATTDPTPWEAEGVTRTLCLRESPQHTTWCLTLPKLHGALSKQQAQCLRSRKSTLLSYQQLARRHSQGKLMILLVTFNCHSLQRICSINFRSNSFRKSK